MYIVVRGSTIWLIDNKLDRSRMMRMIDGGLLQETTNVLERVIEDREGKK